MMNCKMHAVALENETEPVADTEHQELLSWLSDCGLQGSVGIVLRRSPNWHDRVIKSKPGDPAIPGMVKSGSAKSLERVYDEWHTTIDRQSVWSSLRAYESIGICSIHGPAPKLQELFEKRLVPSHDSPIAGYIYGGYLTTAESAVHATFDDDFPAAFSRTLTSFALECFEMGRRGIDAARVTEIADAEMLSAALFGGRFDLPWLCRRRSSDSSPCDELRGCRTEFDYLGRLGIGDPRRWGSDAGKGQVVAMIDSGTDESHPMLREQVRHYLRYDCYGHDKEAYACMDHACHGTKMAAYISGVPMLLADLPLEQPGTFRFGIAPGAKLFVISALGGDMMRESGTWDQLFAGLRAVVDLKGRLKHEIVNISMEPNGRVSPHVHARLNDLLALLKQMGLVPILAAGNRGPDSCSIGDAGYYVGAMDANGRPCPTNGPRCDLLAPGDNLLCAHPASPRLNGLLIGRHSGSSLASAIVAGAVATVASARRMPASEAIELLIARSRNGRLWIDGAL